MWVEHFKLERAWTWTKRFLFISLGLVVLGAVFPLTALGASKLLWCNGTNANLAQLLLIVFCASPDGEVLAFLLYWEDLLSQAEETCRTCGYNSGLSGEKLSAQRCPECGNWYATAPLAQRAIPSLREKAAAARRCAFLFWIAKAALNICAIALTIIAFKANGRLWQFLLSLYPMGVLSLSILGIISVYRYHAAAHEAHQKELEIT